MVSKTNKVKSINARKGLTENLYLNAKKTVVSKMKVTVKRKYAKLIIKTVADKERFLKTSLLRCDCKVYSFLLTHKKVA